MSSQPIPGWYDDPQTPGYRRWWDGTSWTDQRRPIQEPTIPAAMPGAFTAPPAMAAGVYAPKRTLRERFDPNPDSHDSITTAVQTIKTAFWRIFLLALIGFGGSLILSLIGQALSFLAIADGVRSSTRSTNFGFDGRGDLVFDAGPSAFSIIAATLVSTLFFGGAMMLLLWVFAAIVKVVRGQQQGVNVGVGTALLGTWPRTWRFIVLSLVALLIWVLLLALTSVLLTESLTLGVLLGIVAFVVGIGLYTAVTGLYAWLISPTSQELSGEFDSQT